MPTNDEKLTHEQAAELVRAAEADHVGRAHAARFDEEQWLVKRVTTPDPNPPPGFDELGRPVFEKENYRALAGVVPVPSPAVPPPVAVVETFRDEVVLRLEDENKRLRKELLDRANKAGSPLLDKVEGLRAEIAAVRRRAEAAEARIGVLQTYSNGLNDDNAKLRKILKADPEELRDQVAGLQLSLRSAQAQVNALLAERSQSRKTREYRIRVVPATTREIELPDGSQRVYDLKLEGGKLRYLLVVSIPGTLPPKPAMDLVRSLRESVRQLCARPGPAESEIVAVGVYQGSEVQVFELIE